MSDTIRACPLCRWCDWMPRESGGVWFECRGKLPNVVASECCDAEWPVVDGATGWCRKFELDPEFAESTRLGAQDQFVHDGIVDDTNRIIREALSDSARMLKALDAQRKEQ